MVILQLKQEIDDLKNKNQSLLQEAGEKQQLENQISQLMAEKRSFEEKQSEATQDQIVSANSAPPPHTHTLAKITPDQRGNSSLQNFLP